MDGSMKTLVISLGTKIKSSTEYDLLYVDKISFSISACNQYKLIILVVDYNEDLNHIFTFIDLLPSNVISVCLNSEKVHDDIYNISNAVFYPKSIASVNTLINTISSMINEQSLISIESSDILSFTKYGKILDLSTCKLEEVDKLNIDAKVIILFIESTESLNIKEVDTLLNTIKSKTTNDIDILYGISLSKGKESRVTIIIFN